VEKEIRRGSGPRVIDGGLRVEQVPRAEAVLVDAVGWPEEDDGQSSTVSFSSLRKRMG
jgi:hypothetical protein